MLLYPRDWAAVVRGSGPGYPPLLVDQADPSWWIVAPWQRFDALEYQSIATYGYAYRFRDAAFAPLYPLLMRLVGVFTGGPVIGGLVVSTIALVVALVLLRVLVTADRDRDTAFATMLVLLAFPTAFFLLAPYTEALFLALALGTFIAVRARRPLLAGVLCAIAIWCRQQGALLAIPIAVAALTQLWTTRRPSLAWSAALTIPLASFAAYEVWLGVLGYSTPFEVQQVWWRSSFGAPLTTLAHSWTVVTQQLPTARFEALGLAAFALTVACGVACVAMRFPVDWALYTLASAFAMAWRESEFTPLLSADRFILAVFPVFVVIAALIARRRALALVVLGASALMQIVLLAWFAQYRFVG